MMDSTSYTKKVKEIISHKVGIEPSEITKESFFEEDLNIGGLELVEILTEIEDALVVDLIDKKDDIMSVQDLLDIIAEQVE
jgi:acyl carrier protein